MPFNSLQFFLFLALVSVAFYATKNYRVQKMVLIVGSAVFTTFFNWLSAVIILLICFSNFQLLKKVSKEHDKFIKKRLYLWGVCLNVLVLLGYKILQDLLTTSGLKAFEGFNNSKWIILGIGFYMLQIIGYYFDVYKKNTPFTLGLTDFALSIAFFSKMPSGPILNLDQSNSLFKRQSVTFYEGNLAFGIQRILLGLFKKVALADRLLPYVNQIFNEHAYINGFMIYLGPILFTLQLYFDFSGYIDIAIGSARIFNIKLPENFNLPLRSQSIIEFWRRWHISLVNWLTHYIFYPVSFRYRKFKKRGIAIAVICTFLVSAAWHGFALTFFIWALCHFTYIILENILKMGRVNRQNGLRQFVRILFVWHLVAFSNLFFRAPSLNDVFELYRGFKNLPFLLPEGVSFKTWLINGGQDIEQEFNFRLSVLLCLLFLILEKKISRWANSEKYNVVYVVLMLISIAIFGMFNTGERFIYLQF